MEKKYKIHFNDKNVQGSVAYTLVSEFNLVPNILKAKIEGDGEGNMIIGIEGDEKTIDAGVKRLVELGFEVKELGKHISHDEGRCFNCGACVSVCPTKSIVMDKDTYIISIDDSTCIACGSCIDACSVKALDLKI